MAHLRSVFAELRATFAVLEPMFFDSDVIDRWGQHKRGPGFRVILNALLNSCVLGISKIALDAASRTPSIKTLVSALTDKQLISDLREEFAVWNIAPTVGPDPSIIEMIQSGERRDEAERRIKFDTLVQETVSAWEELQSSATLRSFVTMRDKIIAHYEVVLVESKYEPFDVSSLNLKVGDLKIVIDEIALLIGQLSLLFSNASYAFDSLERQVLEIRNEFWRE